LIIDGHIHAGGWSPSKFLGRGVSFEEMEACLETCGIGGAVLTSTDLRENDLVSGFVQGPHSRLYWFFPWVHPGVGEDLTYLRKNRKSIHGMKLHPSCDGVRITDAKADPFLAYAVDEGLPVMVHCGRWQEMASYRYALEAASKHPGTVFILSHMGGDIPELEMATIDHIKAAALSNVRLGIEGVREYWAVERAVKELGADKVIFGSDYPLGHPKMYLGLVDALAISAGEKDLVLGGNILRLLGEAK
jgi:predicted TIM-barrel fold metal-dependent hydrolase